MSTERERLWRQFELLELLLKQQRTIVQNPMSAKDFREHLLQWTDNWKELAMRMFDWEATVVQAGLAGELEE